MKRHQVKDDSKTYTFYGEGPYADSTMDGKGIIYRDYEWIGKINATKDFDFEEEEITMRVRCVDDPGVVRADIKLPLHLLKEMLKSYEKQSYMTESQNMKDLTQVPPPPKEEKKKEDYMCTICWRIFEDITKLLQCERCDEWYCSESHCCDEEDCGGIDRQEGSLCRDCALKDIEEEEKKELEGMKRKRKDSLIDGNPKTPRKKAKL